MLKHLVRSSAIILRLHCNFETTVTLTPSFCLEITRKIETNDRLCLDLLFVSARTLQRMQYGRNETFSLHAMTALIQSACPTFQRLLECDSTQICTDIRVA